MYILQDLWLGRIDPSGRTHEKDSAYGMLLRLASKSSKALCQELSEAGREAYEVHHDDMIDLAMQSECDSFIYGFRLGARMILDVVGADDSDLRKSGVDVQPTD